MQLNKRKIIFILAGVFLAAQLIRINKNSPPYNINDDFVVLKVENDSLANLIKNACYDCHSYDTSYPWYAEIAPVSWWLKNHVNEGRKHLNFSTWAAYSTKKQKHKMEECYEMIEKNDMPLKSFTWTHPEARLSDEQKATMISYFKNIYQSL